MSLAEQKISYDILKLQEAINDLWKARLNPMTCEVVLRKEADLWSAAGSLRCLLEEVRASNDETDFNTLVEQPRRIAV